MKKVILSIVFAIFFLSNYAQNVTMGDVQKVASEYYKSKNNGVDLDYAKTIPITDNSDTLFYVLTIKNGGFIMVSNERSAPPILGYTMKGNYIYSEMPPGLLYLIEKYKYSISALKKRKAVPSIKINEQWDRYLNSVYSNKKSYTEGDLLINTTWGPEGGYNQYCPTGCPAGCTAVAMAQILYYWECRIEPEGSKSYDNVSADFENTVYNWSAMASTYSDNDNALLIYHAGVSCETDYDTTGSQSFPGKARDGFVDHWGINSNANVKWRIWHLSNWEDMLKDEIDNERPILYSGGNISLDGHSWVLEGYDDDDFLCNWGWYGQYNGPYELGDFDPPGNLGPYNQLESAIFGVEPIQLNGVGTPNLSSATYTYNSSGYSISVPEAYGASSYNWTTNYGTISGSNNIAQLFSAKTATVSVRAYNNLCNIYSPYNSKVITINYGPISGNDILCSSGGNYTISNIPSSANVTWSVSPESYFTVSSGSGNTAFLTPKSMVRGNVTLTFSVNVDGLVALVTKSFWVGKPSNPIIFCPHNSVGMNSQIEAWGTSTAADYYLWSIGGGTLINGQGTDEVLIQTSSRCLYDLTLRLTTSNTCGNTFETMESIPYDCSGGISPLSVIPNPASTEIDVSIVENSSGIDLVIQSNSSESNSSESLPEFNLTVYNNYSIAIFSSKIFGKTTKIKVSDWEKGLYHIIMMGKDKKYTGSFIVE